MMTTIAVPETWAEPQTTTSTYQEAFPTDVVDRAQAGDLEAFEQLVTLYEPRLLRVAVALLGDHGEAEDAVQDVFLQVWKRLSSLRENQAFYAWVRQLTTRRCLDVLRTRTRRRTHLTLGGELEEHAHRGITAVRGPAELVQLQVGLKTLGAIVASFPHELRACWTLRELHGLSYPEIAVAVGASVSTVRGRLARARRRLSMEMDTWR